MIGAVLKTVERSRVPWVRIPPPPPFKATFYGGFFSGWDENYQAMAWSYSFTQTVLDEYCIGYNVELLGY